MIDQSKMVTVQILGKNFTLKVPEDKIQDLEFTVNYLNKTLSGIKQSTGISNYESVITLAALQLADELLNSDDNSKKDLIYIKEKLNQLNSKLVEKLPREALKEL